MALSIITPHYNDFGGLVKIYHCLTKQTLDEWEWIIVDDCSTGKIRLEVRIWLKEINDSRIRFFENNLKTNASVCRNKGIEVSISNNLIFLDSDDYMSEDFVANRNIKFSEFAVYPNYHVVDNLGKFFKKHLKNKEKLLDKFLSAKFLWQTSCVLWDKEFLIQIGKFDSNLERLQDVELCVRALSLGQNYSVVDNKVDFFYFTKQINTKTDIVEKSCRSVNYVILKWHAQFVNDPTKHSLITAYYFACVKNLHRCKNRKDVTYLYDSLKLFYLNNYIRLHKYILGYILLFSFKYHLISDSLFINVNRYLFK
ncbi:MAG: glycosyltransferase family 2 protein [Aquaticitalea sp.]